MIYKTITADQVQSVKESIYEAIPITGTLLSGTYGTWPNDTNVLKFTASHGLFESVYDYPYASSSANHIMDITFGLRSGSLTPVVQSTEKYRIYTQMAQTLLGFDATGSVRNFTLDGTTPVNSALFFNYSRLLTKDGIKVGTFSGTIGLGAIATPFSTTFDIKDNSTGLTTDSVNVDSPAGQYWYIYTGSTYTVSDRVGMVFYQAGIAMLNLGSDILDTQTVSSSLGGEDAYPNYASSGSITEIADGWRRYVKNLQFQNSVQINSTIYSCQVGLNEFNYSANPTYTTASQIRVKSEAADPSISYITTVGLYSDDNQLLAVAKLSEPLKKDPSSAINLRVRLDY